MPIMLRARPYEMPPATCGRDDRDADRATDCAPSGTAALTTVISKYKHGREAPTKLLRHSDTHVSKIDLMIVDKAPPRWSRFRCNERISSDVGWEKRMPKMGKKPLSRRFNQTPNATPASADEQGESPRPTARRLTRLYSGLA